MAVIASAIAGGCGSANTDLLKQPATLVTNGISTLGSVEIPKVAVPQSDPDPVGSPLELYNRVARGATRCWFGAEGHLKGTHIFNASAEPEAKGGSSEIVIHERDPKMPDPRGNRAFRVSITPSGDSATVVAENIRFPVEEGQKMEREVRRWARDDVTCNPRESASKPEGPASPPAPAAKPAKQKPPAKAATKPATT